MTADKSREVLSNRAIFVMHKCPSVLAQAGGFALVSDHHPVAQGQPSPTLLIPKCKDVVNTREIVTAFCSFFLNVKDDQVQ